MGTSHIAVSLKTFVATGATAGDVTVTGIRPHDKLLSVIHFVGGGTDVTAIADLTSEFTISADDTINNTGGTSTASAQILVIVAQADPRGASLNRS